MLTKSILLAILLGCLFVSCDYGSNTIALQSDALPATFKLDGSDKVQWIWVQGPYQNASQPAPKLPAPDDPKKIIIWKVVPGGDFVPLKDIPPVTYGQLPNGWKQEIPQAGSPPPLLDGYVYHFHAVLLRGTVPTFCVYVKGGQVEPYKEQDPNSPCK